MTGHRAIFVDRDGVLNALVRDASTGLYESPLAVDDVALLAGSSQAVRELNEAGWLVICVTNQPAAAKGTVTMSELCAVHARVLQLLRDEHARVDHSEICFHHPDGIVAELTKRCDCRKPEPAMLFTSALNLNIALDGSWMIGDSDSDVEAGRRAGCHSMLVQHEPSAHRRSGRSAAEIVVPSLLAGVQVLLAANSRC